MNNFTGEWLSLREPVDHRSRNQELVKSVASYLQRIESSRPGAVRIVDLGCGTGSNLRALAPVLNQTQKWTLIDSDLNLLLQAHTALLNWSDDSSASKSNVSESISKKTTEQKLVLIKNNKRILVDFQLADLSKEISLPIMSTTDLVTAAAFFDLTSESWLRKFCLNLTKPLYATLSYNGKETWEPRDPSDQLVLEAFHSHQKTDKGFGAAAGPDAAQLLIDLLADRHFGVYVADSPWDMNEMDHPLCYQLAVGIASAVKETGLIPVEVIERWLKNRTGTIRCTVGHTDIFAYP